MMFTKSIYLYLLMQLFGLTFFAHAQDVSQSFEIRRGGVTVTPGFCPPDSCVSTSATLTGTFSAKIVGDAITFVDVNVRSKPKTGFVLPEAPNESSNGTVRRVKYRFDGAQLAVSGSVDSRAFDGPLYEYKFVAQISESQGFDAKGYYIARQDFRKCIYPLCGGMFVKSVNERLTRCADGSLSNECYVASVNWEKLGFDPFVFSTDSYFPARILLKGKINSHIYRNFGELGEFFATEAYRPATNNLAEGTFAALENNGIVCITSPCFSIDESVLNKEVKHVISGFDLNPVGASEKDLSVAYALFANNSPLIVSGYNKKQQELSGIGVLFVANQFYLPIKAGIQKCADGYDLVGDVCTTPHGCAAPLLEQRTIGGAAMIDPVTGEVSANITYSCVASCEPPAFVSGPASCTVAMP
jgi:hypothetical protein